MFLNCSNHISARWSQEQKLMAEKWGEIVDYEFPSVSVDANEDDVQDMAEQIAKEIINMQPDAVMCQGEFTLTYSLVNILKKQGIIVLAACSERKTVEKTLSNGDTEKISVFEFKRFREY